MVRAIGSASEFDALVRSKKPVLVKFCATWCGSCRRFVPTYEALPTQYPSVEFATVDVDGVQEVFNAQFAGCSRVSLPSFKHFKGGSEVGNFVSGADEAAIRKLLGGVSQRSMHSTWNTWRHGSWRANWPTASFSRQTAHVGSSKMRSAVPPHAAGGGGDPGGGASSAPSSGAHSTRRTGIRSASARCESVFFCEFSSLLGTASDLRGGRSKLERAAAVSGAFSLHHKVREEEEAAKRCTVWLLIFG